LVKNRHSDNLGIRSPSQISNGIVENISDKEFTVKKRNGEIQKIKIDDKTRIINRSNELKI